MEAEEEFATLANPVSLPEPVKTVPEIIDLLSSIPKEPPAPKTHPEFFLLMNWVEYLKLVRPKMLQDGPR